MVKFTVFALAAGALLVLAAIEPASAGPFGAGARMQPLAEHGGGCRKSSPPGQCCHMETRTGTVHCH